jgi:hypothetical protein
MDSVPGASAGLSTDTTLLRNLDLPYRVVEKLEKSGFRTVGDVSSTSVEELALVLEGSGLQSLLKSLGTAILGGHQAANDMEVSHV